MRDGADTTVTSELVLPLRGIGLRDRPVAGGKGASLGELARAGARVPPGYVVSVAAFTRALRALDPDRSIPREVGGLDAADTDRVAEVTAAVRARIASAPLPGELAEAVVAGYRDLGGPDGAAAEVDGGADAGAGGAGPAVAVRSSATAEDSTDASFAGLQDSFLWIHGEDAVLAHVRRCWASLYSVESVTYRRRKGLPEDGMAMAVVVQRMVDAACAGVMFTRSPTTGDRSVVAIEGSWGLGSAVVSGEVTPDTYVVSKVTGEILRRTVSPKLVSHRRDQGGGGVRVEEVPEHLREERCLGDDEVRALAELGRRVEQHYGTAQDIEWAVTRGGPLSGRVFLLQSRPETVWAGRESKPVATPKPHAFDHVFERLTRGAPGDRAGGR